MQHLKKTLKTFILILGRGGREYLPVVPGYVHHLQPSHQASHSTLGSWSNQVQIESTVVYFGLLVDISPTSSQSQFSQLVVDRIVQNKKPATYYYPMQLVYSTIEEKQKSTGLENTLKLS